MAKRTRGSARPGQRRPDKRGSARPARPETRVPVRAATGLSDAEEARAAELEAQIVAEERQAEQRRSSRERVKTVDVAPKRAGQSLLAVKAAEEYAYVVRDVRRIVEVGGLMLGLLAVLFALHLAGLINVS